MLFGVNPQIPRTDRARFVQLYEEIIEKLQSIPGVESASISSIRPLSGSNWTEGAALEGSDSTQEVYVQIVRPNYFETMQMPLVSGRALAHSDRQNLPRVAVINETLAKKLFKGGDAIGRHVSFPRWLEGGSNEVVGIVRDAKYASL